MKNLKSALKLLLVLSLIIPAIFFTACKGGDDPPAETPAETPAVETPAETTPTETTYSVAYMLNGGKNHADNPVSYEEDTETITLKAPTRVGYEFLGWYTDGLYGVTEENKVETITSETKKDLVLNAKWKSIWDVSISDGVAGFTIADGYACPETIEIFPEIHDSFGPKRTFNKICVAMGYEFKNIIIHEGIEEVRLTSNLRVENVYFPSTIKSLRASSDYGARIDKIHIKDLAKWCGVDIQGGEYYFNYTDGLDFYLNGNLVEDLTIPEGVTEIKPYVFRNIKNIKSITIPDSVKTIGEYAFRTLYDTNIRIKEIRIGSGLTSLGGSLYVNSKVTDEIDVYFGSESSYRNFMHVLDGSSVYTDILCGKIFIGNTQLTTLNVVAETVDISHVKGIENVVFEDGVAHLRQIPEITGYVILPTSIRSVQLSIQYNASTPYMFKGTKSDTQDMPETLIRYANIYYYSENEPANNIGKAWKFADDGKTAVKWPAKYSNMVLDDSSVHEIVSGVPTFHNGGETIYVETEENVLSSKTFNLYVIEQDGDKILIANGTGMGGTLTLLQNVEGYTNANGEWIHGVVGGNTVTVATEWTS